MGLLPQEQDLLYSTSLFPIAARGLALHRVGVLWQAQAVTGGPVWAAATAAAGTRQGGSLLWDQEKPKGNTVLYKVLQKAGM